MLLVALILAIVILVIPVKIGAHMVGAGRTGFWHCLAALVVSGLISGFALRAFHIGGALSIFVVALGYMLILDTTYLRALAIAVISAVLAALIAFALAATILAPQLHRLMHG